MEKKKIFLLGGHDLEMLTIKDLLKEKQITYYDASLQWDNARLSAYKKQLEDYGADKQNCAYAIYGVELQEDMKTPENYVSIDHHNAAMNQDSALEQVAKILGVTLGRYQKLVAANDKGYIPGMKNADLAEKVREDEIIDIRRKDRKAQGVTEEEEALAEKAILENKDKYGSLIVVKALSDKFSPICDRLFPYDNLLIYTDERWCFYGNQAESIRNLFSQEMIKGFIYYGGGANGYVGLKNAVVSQEEIEEMVEKIQKEFYCSYHIFYFPFKWKLKGNSKKIFSEQVDLEQIPISDCSMWKREQLDATEVCSSKNAHEEKEACELFGERQYFLEFVHPVLYDIKGAENPILYHYERREPQMKEVEYHISLRDKIYTLKVDAINLNLYATGVGILSFYLKNERKEQWTPEAVLDINQFGRRIMPPHSEEFKVDRRSMIAKSISITGLDGEAWRYKDEFDYVKCAQGNQRGLHSVWEPALFIKSLIADLSPELIVTPVLDDRMLVNCWYGNDKLSQRVENQGENKESKFINSDFWYRYVFVDKHDELTCQNLEMKKKLLDDATYFRWQQYGTLYGISRYSMVALMNEGDFSRNVLAMHMRTIYSRMFELIIIQRASMLRFSGEVTKVSCLKTSSNKNITNRVIAQRIGSLYKEYIRFVNQIYFRNVTVQDQGIEMYDMLLKQFASGEQIKDLDEEIGELYQYITLLVDQNRNENGEYLNKLAAIFLPATILTGMFGMNQVADLEGDWGFWMHTALIGLLSYVGYRFIKRLGEQKK